MDQSSLARLADRGLAAFPPSRLADAAAWAWDYGAATGDARWCVLSRTLRGLADSFEDGEAPLPSAVVDEIYEALRKHLPAVLNAESAANGAAAALLLDSEIPWA